MIFDQSNMEIKLEKEIFSTSDLRITRYLFGKWWFLTFISYYIQVLTQSDYVYVLVAQLCPTMGFPMLAPGSDPTDSRPPGSSIHGDSPGKNTGVGCHFLFQIIFPTQGSNLDQTWVSHIAGRFFTIWATREAPQSDYRLNN